MYAVTGDLKMDIPHADTSPGDHILKVRLITTSGTLTVTVPYTVPNGMLQVLSRHACMRRVQSCRLNFHRETAFQRRLL